MTRRLALQVLPEFKVIDHAVAGNSQCGVCLTELFAWLQAYCGWMTESVRDEVLKRLQESNPHLFSKLVRNRP